MACSEREKASNPGGRSIDDRLGVKYDSHFEHVIVRVVSLSIGIYAYLYHL